jgi:hypothetical protein
MKPVFDKLAYQLQDKTRFARLNTDENEVRYKRFSHQERSTCAQGREHAKPFQTSAKKESSARTRLMRRRRFEQSVASYDNLFNTLFIVVSVTIVPFLGALMQNGAFYLRTWVVLSFFLPIMMTVMIWALAVFRGSDILRIVAWCILLFQITRAPFVVLSELYGFDTFNKVGLYGYLPVVIETLLTVTLGTLIRSRYNSLLGVEPTTRLKLIPYLVAVPLALYVLLISNLAPRLA